MHHKALSRTEILSLISIKMHTNQADCLSVSIKSRWRTSALCHKLCPRLVWNMSNTDICYHLHHFSGDRRKRTGIALQMA